MASIEIAIPDSACKPGHSRRPSNEEIRVHRSGLPRMTSRPRALHRTVHTGRPQPAAWRDPGRRRKRMVKRTVVTPVAGLREHWGEIIGDAAKDAIYLVMPDDEVDGVLALFVRSSIRCTRTTPAKRLLATR